MKKILVMCTFCMLFLMGCGETSDTSAYIMSQMFVEKELVAPKTAKYPNIQYLKNGSKGSIRKISDNRWYIRSYVDSENIFGTVMRDNYKAVVEHVEDDRWKLIELKFY